MTVVPVILRRPTRGRSRWAGAAIRAKRGPLPATNALAVWSLVTLGGLALWVVLYALGFSALQESGAQHRLYDKLRYQLAEELPLPNPIPRGTPVATLSIPSIGLTRAVVVQGTSSRDLEAGPGHEADTPLPGEAGVSVIDGRSVTYGAPFRHLLGLHVGSTLTVTTIEGRFRFRVIDLRRAGDPYPPVLAPGKSRVVLVTSTGSGWRSGWAPTAVGYVDADLVGAAVPASAYPATVPKSQLPMRSDTSGMFRLVLWLEALLLVAVAGTAALRWLSRWQTWLLVTPAVMAVLWGVSSAAAPLLPNLL